MATLLRDSRKRRRLDKGKGKEREVPPRDIGSPATAQTPGAGNDGNDEDGQGKGEKKWKNNYKHLIKGIPGML